MVPLPRDGAAYHCTFTLAGLRCGTVTTKGLALDDYEVVYANRPNGVSFMRALCREHSLEVSTYVGREKCTTCGIPVRMTAAGPVHAVPRTLANNLHNGTPDHNATLANNNNKES
jgi:hypothetical protein